MGFKTLHEYRSEKKGSLIFYDLLMELISNNLRIF